MAQIYISATNPETDLRRCRESFAAGKPITITATRSDGSIASVTGVVKSIEDNGEETPPGRRYRVIICE